MTTLRADLTHEQIRAEMLKLLRERGWTKGLYEGIEGVCIVGAYNLVVLGQSKATLQQVHGQRAPYFDHRQEFFESLDMPNPGRPTMWNDAPDRTWKDVEALLTVMNIRDQALEKARLIITNGMHLRALANAKALPEGERAPTTGEIEEEIVDAVLSLFSENLQRAAELDQTDKPDEPISDAMCERLIASFARDAEETPGCPTPQERINRARRALKAVFLIP